MLVKPCFWRSLPEDCLTNNTAKEQQQKQQPSVEEKGFDVPKSMVGLLGIEIEDVMKESSMSFADSDASADFVKLGDMSEENSGDIDVEGEAPSSAVASTKDQEARRDAPSSRDAVAAATSTASDKSNNANLDKVTLLDHCAQEHPMQADEQKIIMRHAIPSAMRFALFVFSSPFSTNLQLESTRRSPTA